MFERTYMYMWRKSNNNLVCYSEKNASYKGEILQSEKYVDTSKTLKCASFKGEASYYEK